MHTPLTNGQPSRAGTRLTGGRCGRRAPRIACCNVTFHTGVVVSVRYTIGIYCTVRGFCRTGLLANLAARPRNACHMTSPWKQRLPQRLPSQEDLYHVTQWRNTTPWLCGPQLQVGVMNSEAANDASAPRFHGAIAYTLQKDAISRSLVCTAPDLAQVHGEAFAACVPLVSRLGEQAPVGRDAAVLWGADTAIHDIPRKIEDQVSSLLPSWYRMCNPVCTQCHVPLVGGWTATRVPYYRRRPRQLRHRNDSKSTYSACTATACTVCKHQQPIAKPASARSFSTVRQRQRQRACILAGQVSEVKPSLQTPSQKKKDAAIPPPAPAPTPPIPHLAIPPPTTTKRKAPDNKAGLRALLQQKKQKEENASKKPTSNLAHFLQQL